MTHKLSVRNLLRGPFVGEWCPLSSGHHLWAPWNIEWTTIQNTIVHESPVSLIIQVHIPFNPIRRFGTTLVRGLFLAVDMERWSGAAKEANRLCDQSAARRSHS